jgi:hypothetical protein
MQVVLSFLILVLLSVKALALEVPIYYEGVDNQTGERCGFTFKEHGYKNNSEHPLNRFAVLSIEDKKYYFVSMPEISEKDRSVLPEKGRLTAVEPYSQGAKMFRLYFDGVTPTHLDYVNHFYYDPRRSQRRTCINLKPFNK